MIERLQRESLREEWAPPARTAHDAENDGSKAEVAALAASTDMAPLPPPLGATDSCEGPGSVSHGTGVGGDTGELCVEGGRGGGGGGVVTCVFMPCR